MGKKLLSNNRIVFVCAIFFNMRYICTSPIRIQYLNQRKVLNSKRLFNSFLSSSYSFNLNSSKSNTLYGSDKNENLTTTKNTYGLIKVNNKLSKFLYLRLYSTGKETNGQLNNENIERRQKINNEEGQSNLHNEKIYNIHKELEIRSQFPKLSS